ncbi:hypothetical protein DICPUDRAFT_80509 [Dictyostelium purpureum]|uniref:Uncharacterized protein n=1 Tax=Dictyostelium purpureum TaxID=5786 RepID=F0ZQP2_DICPU|nr:uncharacterized protein DICPUDRAFT_80509 [Dictyostelium purpureum]EGC33736.1 hypothetical protein DICPUDRAFT_80509 [Dictyostelium purpureum]|eukprot:XP_003289735.1 hypothetical protein DICPUDRAFT_80509 [Dictyostelium purpureum]
MGNFFSKKDSIFEKKVVAMESKISILETRINSSKNYHSAFLYEKFALSSDTLSEKAICFIFSLLTSMIIYYSAKLYRLSFEILIKKNEKKLKNLKDGLEKLFEDRKFETDFERTKKLLEEYERFKKNNTTQIFNINHHKDHQ